MITIIGYFCFAYSVISFFREERRKELEALKDTGYPPTPIDFDYVEEINTEDPKYLEKYMPKN